jgi:hypothetical protein
MLIDDADRPAKWYFALKANLLESRNLGGPVRKWCTRWTDR